MHILPGFSNMSSLMLVIIFGTLFNRVVRCAIPFRYMENYGHSDDLSVSDFRDAKLTHVVIPFNERQSKKLLKNLHSWTEYPPCVTTSLTRNYDDPIIDIIQSESKMESGTCPDVELIFFMSGFKNKALEREIYNVTYGNTVIKKSFSKIYVRYAKLSGYSNSYLNGSRLMFEQVIFNKLGLQNPYYVFYMEPDAKPVRPGWLEVLDSSVRWPNYPCWIKGSLYRGFPADDVDRFHLNGNALYNLRDAQFHRFYEKELTNYLGKLKFAIAYDMFFGYYLRDISQYFTVRSILHKFCITDYIHNVWRTDISIEKYLLHHKFVYIIHGARY